MVEESSGSVGITGIRVIGQWISTMDKTELVRIWKVPFSKTSAKIALDMTKRMVELLRNATDQSA